MFAALSDVRPTAKSAVSWLSKHREMAALWYVLGEQISTVAPHSERTIMILVQQVANGHTMRSNNNDN